VGEGAAPKKGHHYGRVTGLWDPKYWEMALFGHYGERNGVSI
jgi:hypothetical protein